MDSDPRFQGGAQAPDPSGTIPGGTDPSLDPDSTDVIPDGLPESEDDSRPDDWKDPSDGDGIPDDEDMPLPND